MNKGKNCLLMIDELDVSEDVKEALWKVYFVCSSDNVNIKKAVKDVFIISPLCKELEKITKCYERIIISKGVYPMRGSRTYLELAFPVSGKDADYKAFFSSPKLAAGTQNKYSGVFVISFELWKSSRDLMRDAAFDELIKYIDETKKDGISFVFHCTPEFKEPDLLKAELEKHLNLITLVHTYPDIERATEFVVKRLAKAGFMLDKPAKKEIKCILNEKIDFKSGGYRGYDTLEKLVSNLLFELVFTAGRKGEDNYFHIGKKDILKIAPSISVPNEEKTDDIHRKKAGFI